MRVFVGYLSLCRACLPLSKSVLVWIIVYAFISYFIYLCQLSKKKTYIHTSDCKLKVCFRLKLYNYTTVLFPCQVKPLDLWDVDYFYFYLFLISNIDVYSRDVDYIFLTLVFGDMSHNGRVLLWK